MDMMMDRPRALASIFAIIRLIDLAHKVGSIPVA